MKYKDKENNIQYNEIVKQRNSLTAYGSEGLSIIPLPERTLGNEDIIADKENLRE